MVVHGVYSETQQRADVAAQEAPDLPQVTWYKHTGLLKLYFVLLFLMV